MPTAACGINCDVCRLNLTGLCTTCGHGKSIEAQVKLATQQRILGDTCPILACAAFSCKQYCIRDCNQFPCDNYTAYPFSPSFLEMQKRRRQQLVPQIDPLGRPIQVPQDLWEGVKKKDLNLVNAVALTQTDSNGNLVFAFLNQIVVLDLDGRSTLIRQNGMDTPLDNPLLTLTALHYFKSVDRIFPLGKELISTKDMKQGLYFKGGNELKTEPVLRRFKDAPEEFVLAAKALGGETVDMADTACVLYPFPQVPVYYLFWDLSGAPRLSVLFDRSIEFLLDPPIIWGLVNLINAHLFSV